MSIEILRWPNRVAITSCPSASSSITRMCQLFATMRILPIDVQLGCECGNIEKYGLDVQLGCQFGNIDQEIYQVLDERFNRKRFGQVVVESDGDGAFTVPDHCMCRECNRRNIFYGRIRLQLIDEAPAIQYRHRQVGNDKFGLYATDQI